MEGEKRPKTVRASRPAGPDAGASRPPVLRSAWFRLAFANLAQRDLSSLCTLCKVPTVVSGPDGDAKAS